MSRPWSLPAYWYELPAVVQEALMAPDVSGLGDVHVENLQRHDALDDDGDLTEFGRELGQFGTDLREMEKSKLTVYRWEGWRSACPAGANGSKQTQEVVAARSMAAAARAAGVKRPAQLSNFGDTGNERDIAAAMSEPGTVFWCPLDARRGPYTKAKDGD